jgi:predicted GNAT family acetyltransferase
VFRDANEFAVAAQSWLAADPFSTSVLAGALHAVQTGRSDPPDGVAWIAVMDKDEVVGAAMHTPPYYPFLPRLAPGVAGRIMRALYRAGAEIAGVTGEAAAVTEFADAWTTLTGGTSSVAMSMRMYRLEMLNAPVGVTGQPRPATESDLELVADWFDRFHAEAAPDSPDEDPVAAAVRRVATDHVWLWEDHDVPVSLASAASALGVARIGPVYTPPPHRRQGYGAAVTARVAQACLDSGAANVILYTDLANATSNSIYQQIGFRPDHDAQQRQLHRRS